MTKFSSSRIRSRYAGLLLTLIVWSAPALSDEAPRAPAGQMCPEGAYVIGFDHEGNIICSDIRQTAETPMPAVDVSSAPPSAVAECPENCARLTPEHGQNTPSVAKGASPAASVATVVARPVIDDVEPSSVVYGKREVMVTIIGTGFDDSTVVRFNGATFEPSHDGSGNRLTVTLPTRELSMGAYGITVSNGPGQEHSLKRAFEVF